MANVSTTYVIIVELLVQVLSAGNIVYKVSIMIQRLTFKSDCRRQFDIFGVLNGSVRAADLLHIP